MSDNVSQNLSVKGDFLEFDGKKYPMKDIQIAYDVQETRKLDEWESFPKWDNYSRVSQEDRIRELEANVEDLKAQVAWLMEAFEAEE